MHLTAVDTIEADSISVDRCPASDVVIDIIFPPLIQSAWTGVLRVYWSVYQLYPQQIQSAWTGVLRGAIM